MSASTAKSQYWTGVRHGAPFMVVVGPFALLFGVVGTEAGLNLAEVMGFSVVVIAGASQFTAVQLMADEAPTLLVIVTALAVNLRMAMYSAALTPHLGAAPLWIRALAAYFLVDQTYALGQARFEARPEMTLSDRVAYYFGAVTPICPLWYAATLAGALIGEAIPPGYALDFAVPITFLAMVAPALRTLAHVAAAVVSVLVALLLAGLPYSLGVLVAGVAAMAAGAQVELWLGRRA
ncbi:Predicted branched-chain amino acid permease (azaleucine resistance) [Rhodovulum sp. ES.010]|uniref:AzlC family ABC transporter permease n=1 Tax=Rhodovulum sp. ES.010 TaxID=1882821 RepID=UPI000925A578|nr:AzlC family ABC transporter permease [Rhodovulum sp. ES.010]SIO46733.1 Predicted branched-chain amino acid permease (azaleucine resistance) [Rhodovulum sp. ES.010]